MRVGHELRGPGTEWNSPRVTDLGNDDVGNGGVAVAPFVYFQWFLQYSQKIAHISILTIKGHHRSARPVSFHLQLPKRSFLLSSGESKIFMYSSVNIQP